jgi:hypothetical protein
MSIIIEEPIDFITEKNHYLIDGDKFWRATRVKGIINNPGLVNWQVSLGKKESFEIMTARADFGTKNHQLFKLILEGKKLKIKKYDEETQENIKLFNEFLSEHEIKTELLEQHLWNEKLGYAGTADFIGYVDNELMILDWKTSKAIYPDMWLQLSAYVVAFEELTSLKVDKAGILLLRDNKKKFVTKTYNEMLEYFEIFKACLKIYNWQKRKKNANS